MVKKLEFVEWIALGISTLLLAIVYLLAGFGFTVILAVLPALAWGIPRFRRSWWGASAIMVSLLALTAFGLSRQIAAPVLLINSIPVLVFWDLNLLAKDIPAGQPDALSDVLAKNHLRWLGIVSTLAAVLLTLVAFVRVDLPFGWVITLTLALVVGFVALVRKIGKTS